MEAAGWMDAMTDDEIKRLRVLCQAATPQPWTITHESDGSIRVEGPLLAQPARYCRNKADATFIAVARGAVPALLDEVERLRAAWRTNQERDNHPETCGIKRAFLSGIGGLTGDGPYIIDSPCTCGLHTRQAEARKVLDGE